MHDHWPAAGEQRVEAGLLRGAGDVEAGWGGQQKQMTLPQGCCSHCPADIFPHVQFTAAPLFPISDLRVKGTIRDI